MKVLFVDTKRSDLQEFPGSPGDPSSFILAMPDNPVDFIIGGQYSDSLPLGPRDFLIDQIFFQLLAAPQTQWSEGIPRPP